MENNPLICGKPVAGDICVLSPGHLAPCENTASLFFSVADGPHMPMLPEKRLIKPGDLFNAALMELIPRKYLYAVVFIIGGILAQIAFDFFILTR